MDKETIT